MPLDASVPTKVETVWRIDMLGGLLATPVGSSLSVEEQGSQREPVERFRTHKAALLLARLALFSRRAHGREELADLLWPEMSSDRGRANLTLTLTYLRQALREPRKGGLFVTDHKTIRLDKDLLQTDVALWEANAARALASSSGFDEAMVLSAVLADYKGDLLPGFYDDWVCDERSRLTAIYDALQTRHQVLQATSSAAPVRQPDIAVPVVSPQTASTIVNAPLYLTRFFGRTYECESVCRLLRQTPPVRLLTLVGMGGIGKTRLALEVSRAVLQRDKERNGNDPSACFGWVAFSPVEEARTSLHMEGILLRTLGIQGGGANGLTAVANYLNDRAVRSASRLLLILDNLEQLGEAAALVVGRLLADVPALTILATSRQPVGIPGEQEKLIGPLGGAADRGEETTPDDVRLFMDRARLVRPELASMSEIDKEVARLCTLLEGVPLALELAAAWIRVMSPSQITAHLNKRFEMLSLRGAPKATVIVIPKRHQSLHAAIAWSYDLLEPTLQTFFAQLSVFHGGWTAEAAQSISGIPDVTELHLRLVERSLIFVDESVGKLNAMPRYRMLESLREFGSAQLNAHEREPLLLRHAAYFEALSQTGDHSRRVGTREERARLLTERDNLRAAVVSSLLQADSDTKEQPSNDRRVHGIQIALRGSWLWTLKEAEYLCNLAAAALPLLPEEARNFVEADVLLAQGTNALFLGDCESANHYFRASLVLYEAARDRSGAIRAKGRLANLAYRTGDTAGAVAAWRDCVAESQRTGDWRLESAMLNNLAVVVPDLDERRRLGEQSVLLDRIHAPDSYFLACSLNTLGNAAREQGDYKASAMYLNEGYEVARADGAVSTVALLQTSLAELHLEMGDSLDRAHELLSDAQSVLEEGGELPQVAEILCLRFRLAVMQGAPSEALSLACEYLRLARKISRDASLIADRRADFASQLTKAGFAAHAERWDLFCQSTD